MKERSVARRLHWHAPEKGSGPAFVLSLLAHAVLFLAIAFVVRWKTEPVGTVSAELWGGFPAAPPPPVIQPAPPPPPVVQPAPPPPPPKVEPTPEPEPRKADIVVEKKAEPPKKLEPPKKVEPPKEEAKKIEPVKKELPKAEPKKEAPPENDRDAQRRREEELKRIAAAAGGPTSSTAPPGAPSRGGSAPGYEGQVVACVRPHIVFNVPDGIGPRQYVAEFEVQLLPTGEQAGAPKLLKASGLGAYDQAVERAIRRCDPFPRPREGTLPRTLRLTFDPVDTR